MNSAGYLNYLLPINLTLSPVIFISIKLSLPGKNDVTYKSIERIVGSNTVSPAISVPKDKYDMKEKQRCMILFFFNFLFFQ